MLPWLAFELSKLQVIEMTPVQALLRILIASLLVFAGSLPQAVAACRIVPSALGKQIGDVASLMAAITRDDVRRTAMQNTTSHDD